MSYKYKVVDENGKPAYLTGEEDLMVRVTSAGILISSKVPLQLKKTNREKIGLMEPNPKETYLTITDENGDVTYADPKEFEKEIKNIPIVRTVEIPKDDIYLDEKQLEPIISPEMPPVKESNPDEVNEGDTIEFNLNGETKVGEVYKLFDGEDSQEIAVKMLDGGKVVIPAEDCIKVVDHFDGAGS